MKDFWNDRYAQQEFIYGVDPNNFLRENLEKLPVGTIIFPCEGEGRNAVYAAKMGWQVSAFDYSDSAKEKAAALAKEHGVNLTYEVASVQEQDYLESSADVVALVYAHLPTELRIALHQKAIRWVKPGGRIILEAFNPKQFSNSSGGPKNEEMLYTIDMLRSDFDGLIVEKLEAVEVVLSEGRFHEGKADVVRLVARKAEE